MIVGVVGLIVPPSALAVPVTADTQVVSLHGHRGKISGYGDLLAWSEYRAADATFHLIVQQGARAPRRLAIRPRNRPFDVDAGPDRDGRPALVYSRCGKERKQPDRRGLYGCFGLPGYPGGSSCDVYTYSPSTGRERQMDDISLRDSDEFMPSIWRGSVAFARRYRNRAIRLYLNHGGDSSSRRLVAWTRRRAPEIVSTDLRGRRLAYTTATLVDPCEPTDVRIPNDDSYNTHIRIAEPGQRSSTVATSCNNDARRGLLAGGIWSGSTVIYSVDSGPSLDQGRIVGRSLQGLQQTLATYAFPDSIMSYLAANGDGIYGVVHRSHDGEAHISRLLDGA